jgi:hypothetical protein
VSCQQHVGVRLALWAPPPGLLLLLRLPLPLPLLLPLLLLRLLLLDGPPPLLLVRGHWQPRRLKLFR